MGEGQAAHRCLTCQTASAPNRSPHHGLAALHQQVDLAGAADNPLAEALDKNATPAVLPDGQVGALWFEHVGDDLVVDLEVGSTDQVLAAGARGGGQGGGVWPK
eukprot:352061-Chlamydomonas_euryale.AAC.3